MIHKYRSINIQQIIISQIQNSENMNNNSQRDKKLKMIAKSGYKSPNNLLHTTYQ